MCTKQVVPTISNGHSHLLSEVYQALISTVRESQQRGTWVLELVLNIKIEVENSLKTSDTEAKFIPATPACLG